MNQLYVPIVGARFTSPETYYCIYYDNTKLPIDVLCFLYRAPEAQPLFNAQCLGPAAGFNIGRGQPATNLFIFMMQCMCQRIMQLLTALTKACLHDAKE